MEFMEFNGLYVKGNQFDSIFEMTQNYKVSQSYQIDLAKFYNFEQQSLHVV